MLVIVPHDRHWTIASKRRIARLDRADFDGTASDAGKLRKMMHEAGFTVGDVIVAMPRTGAVLRHLEVPCGSDYELPSLVALQLETLAAGTGTEIVTDFVPSPPTGCGTTDRTQVLTVSASRAAVREVTEPWKSAGFRVVAVTIGSLSHPLLSASSSGCDLTLAGDHEYLDVTIAREQIALNSQTLRCDWSDPRRTVQQIKGAVARLAAALPQSLQAEIRSARLCLPEIADEFMVLLQTELQVAITRWNSEHSIPTDRSLASAIGVLKAIREKRPFINFIAPRRATRGVRQRWQRIARGAAAATLLAGLAGVYWFDEHSNLQEMLSRRKARQTELQELNDRGSRVVAANTALQDWQAGQVNWSRELTKFGKHVPDSEAVVLRQLSCEFSTGLNRPVVRANGIAREPHDVLAWQDRLISEHNKYILQPHGIESGSRDPEFPVRFEIDATIQDTTSPQP